MKELKKGFMFGIGLVIPLLVVVIGAVSVNAMVNRDTKDFPIPNPVLIDSQTSTRYIWLESEVESINKLSSNIISCSNGGIITGTYKTSYDGGKTIVDVPIIKNGYIVTFRNVPTVTEIENIDLQMSINNMKRDGGKTVIDKITDVKTIVDTLSSKVAILEAKVVK